MAIQWLRKFKPHDATTSPVRSRCHFEGTFVTDQIFLVFFRFSLLSLRFGCAVLAVDVTERDTGLFRGFEFAELKKCNEITRGRKQKSTESR